MEIARERGAGAAATGPRSEWIVRIGTGFPIRFAGLSMLLVLAVITPGFTAAPSLLSLINTGSLIGCVAVGMTFITLSGNIMSFSLGATTGVAAIVCAALSGFGAVPALASAIAVAIVVSAAQGFIIGYFRANPIIVSIAALALIHGAAEFATGSKTIYAAENVLDFLKAKVGGIPLAGLVFLASVVVGQVIQSYTQFGQRVMMVGSNLRAAIAAGVQTWRTVTAVYALAGLFAGLAGILIAGRYGAGTMEYGEGYDYSAIAGVLVGGTAIAGGEGSVSRSFFGVVVIASVTVMLLLRGFETEYQYLFIGLIVLAAVLLQGRLRA